MYHSVTWVDENRGQDVVEILVVAGGWPFFADRLVVMNKCAQMHDTNIHEEERYCV